MSRYIVLKLTEKEAQALDYVVGNATDAFDHMESLFPKPKERRTAYQAARKLRYAAYCSTFEPIVDPKVR